MCTCGMCFFVAIFVCLFVVVVVVGGGCSGGGGDDDGDDDDDDNGVCVCVCVCVCVPSGPILGSFSPAKSQLARTESRYQVKVPKTILHILARIFLFPP